MGADEILEFVVDFNGVHHSVGGNSLGETQGGISGEGAEFENRLWRYHAHKHLQHTPLQMPRAHARTQMIEMRGSVQITENLTLGINMTEYILL